MGSFRLALAGAGWAWCVACASSDALVDGGGDQSAPQDSNAGADTSQPDGTVTPDGAMSDTSMSDTSPAIDSSMPDVAPDSCGVCCDGDQRSCYTGPNKTLGVGTCKGGTQTCAMGMWPGNCPNEVTPTMENCCDNLDHNCNGLAGCMDKSCVNDKCCIADAGPG